MGTPEPQEYCRNTIGIYLPVTIYLGLGKPSSRLGLGLRAWLRARERASAAAPSPGVCVGSLGPRTAGYFQSTGSLKLLELKSRLFEPYSPASLEGCKGSELLRFLEPTPAAYLSYVHAQKHTAFTDPAILGGLAFGPCWGDHGGLLE